MADVIRNTGPARIRLPKAVVWLMIMAAALMAWAQPAAAQSILRDAETEALLRDISRPLIEAAGLSPNNVRVVIIQSNEINAFVAGGQIVYIHSALITRADNANEVQGVIAHELGHITGGHIISIGQGYQRATNITLLSLLLGAAAIAAGAGEAAMGIFAAGQQAAMGSLLAFSRVQESAADQAGVSFLHRAGISGRGSLTFFGKLQNMEFRLGMSQDRDAGYGRTHPLTGDRMQALREAYEADPAWNRQTAPDLEARFQRVRAKLAGYVNTPEVTFRTYPESDLTIPARYARAYAWHRSAHPDRALAETDALLQTAPNDPYFLELKGQILLESGRPTDALDVLRRAVAASRNEPLIGALFGHALLATEDPANFAEAERILRTVVQRDDENPFAWYQLGVVYDREGDVGRAQLATAERYSLTNQPQLAMISARNAMAGIPTDTPDWLRAQDIEMSSRAQVERTSRRRRGGNQDGQQGQ